MTAKAIAISRLVEDVAFGARYGLKFISGRGVRAVYGSGLENRRPPLADHGFESHPLRHFFPATPGDHDDFTNILSFLSVWPCSSYGLVVDFLVT